MGLQGGAQRHHLVRIEVGQRLRAEQLAVAYEGILPDLFSEGKGVVAQGRLDGDGLFRADEVEAMLTQID
ncbi:hypothetical protein DAI43_23675, partial [Achromobacter xylosoxidans]